LAGFRIRAITLLYGAPPDAGEAEELAYKLLEARDRVVGELGVAVESVRLTFAPAGGGLREAADVAEELSDVDLGGVFVNLGSYRVSGPEDAERLAQIASREVFASALYSGGGWEEARLVSDAFHRAASESPDYPVYIAFNPLGEPLETPYYPLSSARRGERLVAAALLYPNYLRKALRSGGMEALERAAAEAASTALRAARIAGGVLGVERAAVDLSISPWMEESSLALAEEVAGVRLPEPGFAWGLEALNEAIARVASRLGDSSIGFNEVQLPVAEDSKLKLRAAEGETTARDLLRLSGVCLAGLDMAVIPASRDALAGLLLDAVAYSRVKGRVVGVRVIPVEEVEPGDKVFLKRFGEVPVIAI
jgi:uncharacterized protein (UPF0210 family)